MLTFLPHLTPALHSGAMVVIPTFHTVIPSEARDLLFRVSSGSLTSNFFVTMPDWAIVGACLGLTVAVFLFVFYIHPDASDLAPHRTKLDQLLERRDTIYENLRDLKFEHRAGKYSEGDYELMKASLENEAAMVLTEIEQVTESQVRRPRPASPATNERSAR
ncbi:MAG TPA: hypothetical protein VEI54_03810 [Candidatus Limnocylindrales bacterium]|nr:hypothetical protein [Candidatus Limnocylindrales bacterium]